MLSSDFQTAIELTVWSVLATTYLRVKWFRQGCYLQLQQGLMDLGEFFYLIPLCLKCAEPLLVQEHPKGLVQKLEQKNSV